MDVRSRAAALAMGVGASCLAGCTVAPPVTVTCTSEKDQIDIVGLDVNQGKATLFSVSPPLSGTVQASPTEYDVLFQPGPAGTPRLHLKINRYTFRMTREPGAHGAEAGGTAPAVSTGLCERYRIRPL